MGYEGGEGGRVDYELAGRGEQDGVWLLGVRKEFQKEIIYILGWDDFVINLLSYGFHTVDGGGAQLGVRCLSAIKTSGGEGDL